MARRKEGNVCQCRQNQMTMRLDKAREEGAALEICGFCLHLQQSASWIGLVQAISSLLTTSASTREQLPVVMVRYQDILNLSFGCGSGIDTHETTVTSNSRASWRIN
jgi:hypothetical protein